MKSIIPCAGLGTRFLPLTKILNKETLPLVDFPMIDYSVREAKDSDISEIIFILSESKKAIPDFFKPNPKMEQFLESREQDESVKILKKISEDFSSLVFSYSQQLQPQGDGDAILKAKKAVGKEDFSVLFPDDIFYSKTPAISQLLKVFQTSQKPIIGLKKVEKEKLSSYGVVEVEKIANRLYRIKKIVEKPKDPLSDLAICGRYVLTNDIFSYLSKSKPNKKGEIILAEALKDCLEDGKMMFGVEIEGEWLECGKTIDWLKSSIFLALQHKEYGPVVKKWLKTIWKK